MQLVNREGYLLSLQLLPLIRWIYDTLEMKRMIVKGILRPYIFRSSSRDDARKLAEECYRTIRNQYGEEELWHQQCLYLLCIWVKFPKQCSTRKTVLTMDLIRQLSYMLL